MNGHVNYSNGMYIPNHGENFKIAKSGSVLLCIEGANAGNKIAINFIGDIHVARQIMAIHSFINPFFTEMYLSSIVSYLRKHAKSQIPGIDRDQILNTVIKVPSLEEQKLIVKKVQGLFSLLD